MPDPWISPPTVHPWQVSVTFEVDDRVAAAVASSGQPPADGEGRVKLVELYCRRCFGPYHLVNGQTCPPASGSDR